MYLFFVEGFVREPVRMKVKVAVLLCTAVGSILDRVPSAVLESRYRTVLLSYSGDGISPYSTVKIRRHSSIVYTML